MMEWVHYAVDILVVVALIGANSHVAYLRHEVRRLKEEVARLEKIVKVRSFPTPWFN